MYTFAHSRLEELADDLGFQRGFRQWAIFMMILFISWFAVWKGSPALIPSWFTYVGIVIGVLLGIVFLLMLINFNEIQQTKSDLTALIELAKRQADLLNLLNPIVADAFRLGPTSIRATLVERLTNDVIEELGTDRFGCRNFLQHQPDLIQNLVRDHCREVIKGKQQKLGTHLQNRPLSPHEIKLLVDDWERFSTVLDLIPDHSQPTNPV